MRIVIAEDLHLLRDGLSLVLSTRGYEIVAAVGSGPELRAALDEHRPDLAIVDVRLPPTYTDEGIKIALEARRKHANLPVLVLSQHVEQLYARELLADGTGGIGYLLKDRVMGGNQFIEAVTCVAGGGTVMDPDVITKLMARNTKRDAVAALTPREQDILTLMAEGLSNTAIADRLVVSEGAVSKHTTNIFLKLDIPQSNDANRRVLAVLAYLDGRRTD
ncbi:response regulator [Actinokineospora pegani]|uniref:response regulator n=1 Tax=Actinokineospora pegani TaxID=2654637 RepID=UPI0012E9B300|nr:response regulator transcription factor [Actinokineospora pegani]